MLFVLQYGSKDITNSCRALYGSTYDDIKNLNVKRLHSKYKKVNLLE